MVKSKVIRGSLVMATLALIIAGCVVKTATSVVGAGVKGSVKAGGAAIDATADVAGAGIDAVTPDDDGKAADDHGQNKPHSANDHHEDGHHSDDPRPFDEKRDAMADVDAAFEAASVSGKNVLLVLGGNWCHDSRGLARKFEEPELSSIIADNYELVYVDVGYRDRNLDVPRRFKVMELFGTPTVLVLSPDQRLLNEDTVHDWRTADSKPYDETLAYFQDHARSR